MIDLQGLQTNLPDTPGPTLQVLAPQDAMNFENLVNNASDKIIKYTNFIDPSDGGKDEVDTYGIYEEGVGLIYAFDDSAIVSVEIFQASRRAVITYKPSSQYENASLVVYMSSSA